MRCTASLTADFLPNASNDPAKPVHILTANRHKKINSFDIQI